MQKNVNRLGYKKTKIGWIPKDWECVPFTNVFNRVAEQLVPDADKTYQEIGVRSHGKGIFHKPPGTGNSIGNKRVFHCQPGALVFNIVFAWEQAVAVISEKERGMIASHRFPMFRGLADHAFEPFYLLFFKTRRGKYALNLASPGGAGRNKTLGQKELGIVFVPKPSVAEQQAISEVLECWDKAIQGYERKIEKKRKIKKGLMQRLLSGKQRLPGFEGKWREVRLGNVLSRKPTYGLNAASVPYCEELPTYMRITDISDQGSFLRNSAVSVDDPGSADYYLEVGDLVFARTGASTGKTYLYDTRDGRLVFAGFLIRLTPDPRQLLPGFLKLYTDTHDYWKWVKTTCTRSGQPGINGNEYAAMKIRLPSVQEQEMLVRIFFPADSEIRALEQKLTLLKNQKRFLLNNLVTGALRMQQFRGGG